MRTVPPLTVQKGIDSSVEARKTDAAGGGAVARYSVIYADPPWWYNQRANTGKFRGGCWTHYTPMTDGQLRLWASDVCAPAGAEPSLFACWATCPRLDFAIEIVGLAGYRYVGVGFVWVKTTNDRSKPRGGPGHYTSGAVELCLFGVRGSMLPAVKLVPQVYQGPRLEHSEKPAIFRKRLERMYPDVSRIEFFSRHEIDGWAAWGNEVGKLGTGTVPGAPSIDEWIEAQQQKLPLGD